MEPADQYNLRWHYHHAETFLAFESLRRSEAFVDVLLSCEKRSIYAHKVVLSACSNYFFDVLRSVRDGQMPVLFFRDTAVDLLEYVVRYIYNGEVEVPGSRFTDFINLAEALEIKGLKRQDGFTADGCGSDSPVHSAASASYVGKRKYDACADPVCHSLPDPSPDAAELDYSADPKRLRESNVSPAAYLPTKREATDCSAEEKSDAKANDFWSDSRQDYSNMDGAGSSHESVRCEGTDEAEDREQHRPSIIPPQICSTAPITRVAQVIWRGTDLNNRVLYFCEVCLYKTTKNSNAFAHERRHTQEKPYVCACGKAYKAPHPLRVHRHNCPVAIRNPEACRAGIIGRRSRTKSGSSTSDERAGSPTTGILDPPLRSSQLRHMYEGRDEVRDYSQESIREGSDILPTNLVSSYAGSAILDLKENLS